MISIFLLDDHSLVRTGYRLILQQQMDMQVIGEAETGEDGLQKIRALKPDVVLDEHVALSQPTFLDTRQVVAMI